MLAIGPLDAWSADLEAQSNVDEIAGEREAEQRDENPHKIDNKTSRLEMPGFQLRPCAAIAKQAGERQCHAADNR